MKKPTYQELAAAFANDGIDAFDDGGHCIDLSTVHVCPVEEDGRQRLYVRWNYSRRPDIIQPDVSIAGRDLPHVTALFV